MLSIAFFTLVSALAASAADIQVNVGANNQVSLFEIESSYRRASAHHLYSWSSILLRSLLNLVTTSIFNCASSISHPLSYWASHLSTAKTRTIPWPSLPLLLHVYDRPLVLIRASNLSMPPTQHCLYGHSKSPIPRLCGSSALKLSLLSTALLEWCLLWTPQLTKPSNSSRLLPWAALHLLQTLLRQVALQVLLLSPILYQVLLPLQALCRV